MVRTTIQLNKKTKDVLEKQKLYPNETFDQIIQRLVKKRDYDDELSPQTIKDIEEGVKDIKAGRVYTTEQINKELGL
ncbi:MAG: hypothetical protein OEX98_00770 [Nitrosopumilus sp.]|nr:hypothetical protein [Nitrosopumilus sp.]